MGKWENDIKELGYKYQMTDLSACLGLAGLSHLDNIITTKKKLLNCYKAEINHPNVQVIYKQQNNTYDYCPWLCTILVEKDRKGLMKKLRENRVESAQVHYRNDRYSIFGGRSPSFINMDSIEDQYLVLPLHHKVTLDNVRFICSLINEGW